MLPVIEHLCLLSLVDTTVLDVTQSSLSSYTSQTLSTLFSLEGYVQNRYSWSISGISDKQETGALYAPTQDH